MEDKLKKCCPNCSQFYRVNCHSTKLKANLPLFLPCGHSMCENCIVNIMKFMEPIECKVCHRDVEVEASNALMSDINKTKFYEMFPVNYNMVGEMVVENMQTSNGPSAKADDEYFIDLKKLLQNAGQTQGECLECHTTTTKMCQQCAIILCDTCFNRTHKNFIIFKTHMHQSIDSSLTTSNNCQVHKEKPLEYYCKDCKKPICMDCMMVGGEKSCKNHDVVSMQEVNDSFLDDLKNIVPQVDENFRRLTKTAVDIGYLLYNFENDSGPAAEINKIVAAIEQHFSKLCSLVQKHKNEVIDIVLKLKNSEKQSLVTARTDVTNTIKKAKRILTMIKSTADPNKLKKMNLATLLDDAKQVAETPWYLYKDDTNKDPIKVTVNEDICSLITDFIHLEGNIKSDYKLCTAKELAADVEIPPAPPAPVYPPELPKDVRVKTQKPRVDKEPPPHKGPTLYKDPPKYRSKSGSVCSLNSNGSDNSTLSFVTQNDSYQRPPVNLVPPFPESQPKQLREGSQELIYISHIVDPHNFYVQRACHQGLVKDMLREFRNAVSLPKPSVNHITQGKSYLAFNKTDHMWQRCRIVSIDRRDPNKPVFQVFCFDFGSSETVNVDRLRLLPPARVQSPPPLAINCSLANCEPKNGTWTSEDAFLIHNIIDNKQAVIHVRRILSEPNSDLKMDCDVTTFEHGVSLAHALVFHERANMPNPRLPYPRTTTMTEKPKLFMNQNDFKPDSVEEVYITHIVSPDKFFVRKQHLQSVYEKLSNDLEVEYNINSNFGTIYLPEKGMVCAVNVEKHRASAEEGPWARGIVSELPGRGRVRVLLPDSGHAPLVHWSALRHIHTKFTTLRALSTECHLAGITPLQKKWNPNSVALLQKFEGQLLELHVEDNRENRGQGSVGVALYDKTDDDDVICINTEMIKYKFAVSFGLFMLNKDSQLPLQVINNKPPFENPKHKVKTDKKQVTILKKQSPKKIHQNDLDAKDKGPLRLEAKVLHYQSPSLIYVSLVQQQKTFNELFENMQKYYSKNKGQGKESWSVEDRCCALCLQSQTWRRAVILEIDGDSAKVFYSDFACVETVPLASLKELTPEFSKIGDAAIKIHLCGVIPAVGEEWPSLTKEFLKELLDAYKFIFITKVGNFKKDKSMPVEIWVYHTVQGEALDPNKSEWRCLNKKIIEQGLGIPDKSEVATPNANATEGQGDDMLSFLNVTGSVNEWLQLEPMPMVPMKHSNLATSSPVESDNEDAATSSAVVYISDWLPPEPLTCKEFTALPTYIDNDGLIYLHDVQQQGTLDLIRKALDVRFKAADPKAKFARWSVGEPCIALFFLDNRFYRGRVIQVNTHDSTCLIHYIDYGNEEICKFENMRKSIALHQIPVQAHKCVLNRIRPVGRQWERQTLDYIHKSIVEKQCHVKVVGEQVGEITQIELKYDKLWINDHLVDFEMAEYTDGSKASVKKFAPVSKVQRPIVIEAPDPNPEYIIEDDPVEALSTSYESIDVDCFKGTDWNKLVEDEEKHVAGSYLTYPKITEEEFKCNIQIINDINMLELSILYDEETTNIYEQMFEEIESECATNPPLVGIFESKACVAIFPEDGKWYRAAVLEYSKATNKIKVRYVDYGNIEVITVADTREINVEWTKLPPVTVTSKLHGVHLNPDIDNATVAQHYKDTFLDKGPFYAKIKDYDEVVPTVELINDLGESVCKPLIDNKVFLQNE